MENTFNVLTYNGRFVDESKLPEGIYEKWLPTLHLKDVTVEMLAHRVEKSFRFLQITEKQKETYLNNLKECKMITFTLNPVQ